LLKRRLAVTIVAIALVLACAGCGKTETWIFDFATASETEDWVHEEYDDGSATLVTDMGLKLDNHSVCSPVAFTGDFTVTVDLFWTPMLRIAPTSSATYATGSFGNLTT